MKAAAATARDLSYDALFAAMTEGFALCDAIWDDSGALCDYVITEINPALQSILSAGPELIGRKLSETNLGSPDWLKLCEGVLKGGAPVDFEFHNELTGLWHEIRLNRVSPNCLAQFFIDITPRKLSEETQSLLLREMNHRVKNIFAVINGVVALSGRSAKSVEGMTLAVQARIDAVARAHELVLPTLLNPDDPRRRATDLATLAKAVLRPFLDDDQEEATPHLVIEGPPTPIGSGAATALALVLNELGTNALKYGALSDDGGQVHLSWSVIWDWLELDWRETGGPAVEHPPARQGFGTVLADRSIIGQLRGRLIRSWDTGGLKIKITAPLEHLALA